MGILWEHASKAYSELILEPVDFENHLEEDKEIIEAYEKQL
ncbi:hypothetical protein [Priestia megaterium]|nr:hypothetical protein [Priestia megaterium]